VDGLLDGFRFLLRLLHAGFEIGFFFELFSFARELRLASLLLRASFARRASARAASRAIPIINEPKLRDKFTSSATPTGRCSGYRTIMTYGDTMRKSVDVPANGSRQALPGGLKSARAVRVATCVTCTAARF
jgi:hypothetical protein